MLRLPAHLLVEVVARERRRQGRVSRGAAARIRYPAHDAVDFLDVVAHIIDELSVAPLQALHLLGLQAV